jgi:hypothetical protein
MLLQRATSAAHHRALLTARSTAGYRKVKPALTRFSTSISAAALPLPNHTNSTASDHLACTPTFPSYHRKAAMASSTACAASTKAVEVPEVPAGCEQEEQLLQALTSIPLITKAVARPGTGKHVNISVSMCNQSRTSDLQEHHRWLLLRQAFLQQ